MAAPSISGLSPTLGKVGTSVTIAGSGFGAPLGAGAVQGPSTVRFTSATAYGVPAIPTSWSDTSIVVAAPDGATTGNVTVTVAGQSSTSLFTVPTNLPGSQ